MRFQLRSLGWLVVAMTIGLCQSAARADEPFGYFQNDWNVIGLKDYQDGTRITPDNELILAGGDKLQTRFGKDLKPLSRYACKMATGSGKTVVMAMLIAWAFCNRANNPGDSRYPRRALVLCPNLTIKERLQVLKRRTAGVIEAEQNAMNAETGLPPKPAPTP